MTPPVTVAGSVTLNDFRNWALIGLGDGAPTEMSVLISEELKPRNDGPCAHEESSNTRLFHPVGNVAEVYCQRQLSPVTTKVRSSADGAATSTTGVVAERLPAASTARMKYRVGVVATGTFISSAVVVWMTLLSRITSYPVTPRLSVEADQRSSAVVPSTGVDVAPVGLEGAEESRIPKRMKPPDH